VFACDVFAARNRNLDDHVARRAVKAGGLANRRFDHPAGNRIDRRFSGRQRQARAGDSANALSGAERHARSRRAVRHARDDQRAMGDVRVVARILDDSCAREVLAKLLEREREARPRAARQGNGDRLGELASQQRLIGCANGGCGAGAGRPALAQMRFLGRGLLNSAHWTGNAIS